MAVPYRLRVYTPGELEHMVRAAGFVDVACYGDPDGSPISRDTRLVLVATTP